MRHGEVQIRLRLYGEPQKLMTYWRGSMRDTLPTSAVVTILRKIPKARINWWSSSDPNFYFETMTRTEKKRAELSISDKALYMQAPEIATVRELTEVTFGWLSGRSGIPLIYRSIANARLGLSCEGGEELVGVIEKFGDPEVLSMGQVGASYTQGEPRRPDIRWLPEIKGIDTSLALGELQYFEKHLADGQGALVRALISRIGSVFRRRVAARREVIRKRCFQVYGHQRELLVQERPLTDKMVESYQYDEVLAFLDEEAKQERLKDKIRVWRTP